MPSSLPSLDELFNDHDKDSKAAALALRAMVNEGLVAEQDHRRFAWLVNHVFGEKEGDWPSAFDILDKTVAGSLEVPCIVHRAVAALGSGKPLRAFSLMADIAEESACSYAAADATVKLVVLQFSSADEPVLALVEVFNSVLAMLDGITDQLGKLSSLVAASLNNVTSRLMDAQNVDIHVPAYRHALTAGSQTCRSVWQAAGNWMNHERADYLVALCANRLQDYEAATAAARAGLKTIDDNGSEDVDRAFLLLELARAYKGLGQAEESQAVLSEALKLADGFDNDLREWFDARAKAA
jgi:tetratricopeptide (TPR) repeat protein